MTLTDRPVVDLLDPELYRSDPHELWTWMRMNEPLYRDQRNGLLVITRHADVMDVERRSAVFVSGLGYRVNWDSEESNMIAIDDPRHRQQRMLVQHRFSRAQVRTYGDEIQALVDELVDRIVEVGEAEVIDDLAAQLPARLACRLIGLDEDRWRDVKRWSEQLMRVDMRDRDPEAFCGFLDTNRELMTIVKEQGEERRRCPADDLLSIWMNEPIDGERLPRATVLHELGLFIAGGAETTRTVIAHGLRTFCDHPDQWELLAERPDLVPTAVEEVLRWVTPLNNFFRRAADDTEIAGTPVRRGERIMLLYPSANRDEDVFADPFAFDVTRDPNPHLAFGLGTHLCLGAHLAREELGILFTTLTRRLTDLRPITEPDVEANIFARAVRSFRLGVTAR